MAINDKAIQELVGAIAPEQQQKATTYAATVSRVDNEGVVWVYLAGNNMETPTATSSAEVKPGDAVTVEWRNNKLYIAGNVTNPSAGVTRVANVEKAASKANKNALQAQDDASDAMDRANDSYTIAANTDQYFWTTETGTDTGAHITEYPKDEWNDSEGAHYHSGGNLLARSNGIAVRDGLTELANFGASAIQIGQTNDTRLTLTTSGLSIDGYGIQDTPVQFMFLGDSELRANANFNINIGHGISSKTDTYLTTDRVHMDFAHTSLKFDGSSNAVNDPVHVSTENYDNGIQVDSNIIIDADATFNNDLYMKNAKIIYGKDTNGTSRSVVQAYNGSNNVVFGYGGYEGSLGNTNIYGNHINFTARGNINANQPLKVGGYKIITTQTFNADNISITANGYAEGSISITKTGYTPIGVLDTYVNNASSSGSGSSFAAIYRTYHSGNTYYYGLRNVTNSAIKVRVYAKILYVATSQGI